MAAPQVRLRRANKDDAERLLAWRNDPVTRQASLDRREVPPAQHVAWLERTLASDAVVLYIVEEPTLGPCGQVRLNRLKRGGALVSIGLAAEARGRGLGAAALRAVRSDAYRPAWATALYAVIRDDNDASRRAFEAAGFAGPSAEGAAALDETEQGTGVWIANTGPSE